MFEEFFLRRAAIYDYSRNVDLASFMVNFGKKRHFPRQNSDLIRQKRWWLPVVLAQHRKIVAFDMRREDEPSLDLEYDFVVQ